MVAVKEFQEKQKSFSGEIKVHYHPGASVLISKGIVLKLN